MAGVRQHDLQAVDSADEHVVAALPELLDLMFRAWAEPDERARTTILDRCLAPRASYTNPVETVTGPPGVAALIGRVREGFPGFLPVRSSGIDVHHRHVRYGWVLRDSAGQGVLQGLNILVLDQAPLIETVVSFFGPLPRITYTYGSTG